MCCSPLADRGPLSNYVPATTLGYGSITIRITGANAPAAFAVGRTLTIPVSSATRVGFGLGGRILNGTIGQVRIVTPLQLTTLAALQTQPATMAIVQRLLEQNDPGRAP